MSSIESLITIKKLSKSYFSIKGETKVLDNISFNLYKNDFLGIIGPSGCGKSSVLNILAGLDKEYDGKINKIKDLKIGYMLQEHALFPWLSIYENTILGLKIKKELTKDNILYVNNLLKKYNLYEFKDKYPHELSGGMKQRVSLIRTLATKPDILLLDEPFSALDYQTKITVSNDVFNIIKNEKKTAIMVTHDIGEAISMSDRIIVLTKRPGKVKKIYNIKLDNPSTPINNRKDKMFSKYFERIWEDLNE